MRARVKALRRLRNKGFTEQDGLYHAWYSKLMAADSGYSIYKSALGGERKVVEVSSKPTPVCGWSDLVYIGVMTRKWVKSVRKNRSGYDRFIRSI